MTEFKEKKYAKWAAFCLFASAVSRLFPIFTLLIYEPEYLFTAPYDVLGYSLIFLKGTFPLFLLAVLLLTGWNKGISAALAVRMIFLLIAVKNAPAYLEAGAILYFPELNQLFFFFAYAVTVWGTLRVSKGKKSSPQTRVVPAVFFLLECLIRTAEYGFDISYFFGRFSSYLPDLLETAALILMGFRMKEQQKHFSGSNPLSRSGEPSETSFRPAVLSDDDSVGGEEKLKTYRQLYESGLLTREEYQAKEWELLGK